MPTIFTHAFVGGIAAASFKNTINRRWFWFWSLLCPIVPDFDVIAFSFGIPYEHFLGHRGFTHSVLFAFLLAGGIVFFFFRQDGISALKKVGFVFYFATITASHGILDALTSGGLGVAFFSPFDLARYFFPVTPIAVSPIGNAFFSERGLAVIQSELIWVGLPAVGLYLLTLIPDKREASSLLPMAIINLPNTL